MHRALAFVFAHVLTFDDFNLMLYCHWRRKRGEGELETGVFEVEGGGGACPPLLTLHFYFPLELYVYITLTNNYLAFFIYQLIILSTISIN